MGKVRVIICMDCHKKTVLSLADKTRGCLSCGSKNVVEAKRKVKPVTHNLKTKIAESSALAARAEYNTLNPAPFVPAELCCIYEPAPLLFADQYSAAAQIASIERTGKRAYTKTVIPEVPAERALIPESDEPVKEARLGLVVPAVDGSKVVSIRALQKAAAAEIIPAPFVPPERALIPESTFIRALPAETVLKPSKTAAKRPRPAAATGAPAPAKTAAVKHLKHTGTLDLMTRLYYRGGFTVNARGLMPAAGFMVSYAGYEKSFDAASFDARDILEYVTQYREELSKAGACLGGWYDNEESKRIYLDISVCIPDRVEAITAGKLNGQRAIFDIAAGESVYMAAV